MGWRLLGKPVTQKATKKLAKQYAEMDPAPHDRPLSERRLMVYQRLYNEGSFRPVTWATALCVETGGLYRVNGKHTATLLAGLPEIKDFYVTIEEYECDTLEDVAQLYATFDSKMMSRTAADINASFAATIPELSVLPRTVINLAVTGMEYNLTKCQENHDRAQPAERAERLLEYPEYAQWLQEILSGSREGDKDECAKKLSRGPVAAAMFGTFQRSRKDATEFWCAVRDETDPDPISPTRKLSRYLSHTGVEWSTGTHRTRRGDRREFYVKCLHAWNAWRKGEATNLRYFADADLPSIK